MKGGLRKSWIQKKIYQRKSYKFRTMLIEDVDKRGSARRRKYLIHQTQMKGLKLREEGQVRSKDRKTFFFYTNRPT